MKLEITLPLQFATITKLSAVEGAVAPTGQPREYRFGELNPGLSVPTGYTVAGWLLAPPQVGQPVRVLRVVRNGIVCVGYFETTEVVSVGQGEFCTVNSRYCWAKTSL